MKTAIVVFPGSNRERDAARAVAQASGRPPVMVWHADRELPDGVDLVILPGGFAHGDYLRTGAIAAHAAIMGAIKAAAARGVAVLGICNGFQILTEAGLLPGVLQRNAGLKFICRDVRLGVATTASRFTRAYRPGAIVTAPIAHGDGAYFAPDELLDRLEHDDRIAFRYVDRAGAPGGAGNPNGSRRAIAGVLNEARNVLGLMPHLENAIDPAIGSDDGAGLFRSLVGALA